VSGTRIRKPIGLSDWQLAQQRARKWEADGMHGVTAPQTVKAGRLPLFTAKTGTHIHCPLPPVVMNALKAIPKIGRYFFWTSNGKVKSTVGNWQRALKLLFELAEVPTGHAHRFRDAFAVGALLAGIPLERVSILLGHQSVRITERHYSPWVRERQDQIEDDVRRVWESEKRGHALGTPRK
jgi:integrase